MRHLLCLAAWLFALAIVGVAITTGKARGEQVDVAILLAVDVSGSVSDDNWKLQRDGIADAIGSPAFGHAITAGQNGRIAVAVLQRATDQRMVVGWTVLASRAEARALAIEIRAMARVESGSTCMAKALVQAGLALMAWEAAAARRVVDVSGDGPDNCLGNMGSARAALLAQNITINGLPIVTKSEPTVVDYYETKVIGGPGAFLVPAEGYESFGQAMRHKLATEIADAR